jgi:hypothetical protein
VVCSSNVMVSHLPIDTAKIIHLTNKTIRLLFLADQLHTVSYCRCLLLGYDGDPSSLGWNPPVAFWLFITCILFPTSISIALSFFTRWKLDPKESGIDFKKCWVTG